ncbi:MAG: hypothetical protein U0992_03030 [Planctomycetaceae bacterium]
MYCRLSDSEQFSPLPIEQYDYLTIVVETGVTRRGLAITPLWQISRQLARIASSSCAEIAKLLASLQHDPKTPALRGVEITDEDLKERCRRSIPHSAPRPGQIANDASRRGRLKAAMPKLTDVQ